MWAVGGTEEGREPGVTKQVAALTWKAMVPAPLHVQSRQVQPDPHDLLKQPLPDLVHRDLILAIELGRGGHEAPEDGVNAAWGRRSKRRGRVQLRTRAQVRGRASLGGARETGEEGWTHTTPGAKVAPHDCRGPQDSNDCHSDVQGHLASWVTESHHS